MSFLRPTAGTDYSRAPTPVLDFSVLIARLIVGGILFYAGFVKAAGPTAEFAAAIAAYKILPPALINPLAFGLPYVEMWIGIFLLTGFSTKYSAAAALLLFAIFMGVLGSAIIRGIDLSSCGCFGAEALSPRRTIVMDAALGLLAIYTWLSASPSPLFSLDAWLLDERDVRYFRKRI